MKHIKNFEQFINESYYQSKDITRISGLILDHYLKFMKFSDYINQYSYDDVKLYKKISYDFTLSDIYSYDDIKYELSNFIRNYKNLEFQFDYSKINAGGVYYKEDKKIFINTIILFDYFKTLETKKTNDEIKNDVKSLLLNTVVHELNHAYDDYISNRHFDNKSKSVNLLDVLEDDDDSVSMYYNLPHEIRSNFSGRMSHFYNVGAKYSSFTEFYKIFRETESNKEWLNILNNSNKNKILKMLYLIFEKNFSKSKTQTS